MSHLRGMKKMKIGFTGLGRMGKGMAHRIQGGTVSLPRSCSKSWPEVTHRRLIRHDRSENFNGCGKCLALLISSSGSEVTVAAYSLALARSAFNKLRIRSYEKLPLVYSHSADRTNAPAHLGSHCGLHVFFCLRRPPGPGRKSTGAAGGSTGAAAGPREQLIRPAWEQDEAVLGAASSARLLKPPESKKTPLPGFRDGRAAIRILSNRSQVGERNLPHAGADNAMSISATLVGVSESRPIPISKRRV